MSRKISKYYLDFFLFNQTIEHLYNPFEAVNQIYKIIKETKNKYGNEKVNEENIEMLLIKYQKIFEKIDLNSIIRENLK